MKLRWLLILVVFLAGCSSKHDYTNPPWNPEVPVKRAMQWMPISEKAGAAWGVDPQLITAIIAIESGGNPAVVSKSGAVGLMQLKPSTSGRDVYRRMGWRGEPSVSELKNPERNISMGAAYLSILENGPLAGIKDPQVMRYAVVVSYANGAGALLRTFSSNRQDAIEEINDQMCIRDRRNSATSVIQLAMFRLLRKNYVTLIHSADNIQLCANQQYAECKMTCVEKILFDHFATPKSSDQDLPLSLHVAEKNHWATDPHCQGLRLSPTHQTWNMILIAAPSLLLIAALAWKTLFDNQAIIHSSVFSWLTMGMVSGLWWLWRCV